MAQACTIPCSVSQLNLSLRKRQFRVLMNERAVLVLAALALLVLGIPFVLVAAQSIPPAVVMGLWAIVGLGVAAGQAWLGAAEPATREMTEEIKRLVDANAASIHEGRLRELQMRAGALSLMHPNFSTLATQLLLDLREATGEAWRCQCPKRRLPIPLPF